MKQLFSDLFKEATSNGSKRVRLKISLGRVLLIMTFIIMATTWVVSIIRGVPMGAPPALMETFLVLASYVLGTKVVSGLRFKWENGKLQSMGQQEEEDSE